VASQIDIILNLVYGLLGLAIVIALIVIALIVIALIGIANTLALSVHERRREVGLLRAVGMTRPQVRSAIQWESVMIALIKGRSSVSSWPSPAPGRSSTPSRATGPYPWWCRQQLTVIVVMAAIASH
jgi:putative ABC transport system permease protein